jgi:uncharacterized repeat protein (TIGR03803 family)
MALVALTSVLVLLVASVGRVQAQTLTRLYDFQSNQGDMPIAGLAMDRAGNLYGTASRGGIQFGSAYQLSRKDSGWVFNLLHTFIGNGTNDGAIPYAGLTFGPDGALYGTTYQGGGDASGQCFYGCGTVYNLRPPPSACKAALCPWNETVIYRFAGGADGAYPGYGNLIFDRAGNLYGTTTYGGAGWGTVYELTPSNGGWTETVLYRFSGAADGWRPWGPVTLDAAGNLYGTTYYGGNPGCGQDGCGTIYQLSPSAAGWKHTVLYSFQGGDDGELPTAGLVFDTSGNLYGGTRLGGSGTGGTIFQLTPSVNGWTFNLLCGLSGASPYNEGPVNNLTFDAAGNLYGTARYDPDGVGMLFQVVPQGDGWTCNLIYSFRLSGEYGPDQPNGSVILDSNGNIYGTTAYGGRSGAGTIWKITP